MVELRLRLAAAMLALGFPAASQAADLATLDCVAGKLDSATTDQIASDVRQNLSQPAMRGTYSPSVVTAVRVAAAACATENKWSDAASRPAILYTLAKLSLPTVQQAVTDHGLDPAALEAQFQNLSEEDRSVPLTPELYRRLADASIPEGAGRTRETGALLHTFFEFQSILQYASLEFSAA